MWSRNTGQRIPCFDKGQLTRTLMSNIKDVSCKLASVSCIASSMTSRLEPVICSRDTGHIGIHGWVDEHTVLRTYGRTVERLYGDQKFIL